MFFLENFPWIGLIVALSFSGYAVLRKIITVETDIGLFVEEVDPRRSSNESCPFEISEMNKRKTNK